MAGVFSLQGESLMKEPCLGCKVEIRDLKKKKKNYDELYP